MPAFTETYLRKLPNPDKRILLSDSYTKCLLKVQPTGTKTWIYRTKRGGNGWQTTNLGRWPLVGLAQARAKAAALNTRAEDPTAITWSELLQEWYDRSIVPTYKKTGPMDMYRKRGAEGPLRNVKVSQLTRLQLVGALKAYAETAPVAANRCLVAWRLALAYGVQSGYLETNVLREVSKKTVGGTHPARDRVLTDAEIAWIMACPHANGPLLRALLLTGCRINELQSAKVDQVDGNTLHIPETKNGRAHWVHITPTLSKQLGVFEEEYLFRVHQGTLVNSWLRRQGIDWTPHDLRRTAATRMAGLGVWPHVVEAVLNHKLPGVSGIYNRNDYAEERVEAAERLEQELLRITATQQRPGETAPPTV